MKLPKSQRGWFFLPALVAAALTAMVLLPFAASVPQLRNELQAANENPTDENIDNHAAAVNKVVKSTALTATAVGMGTGGDAGDLGSQIIGVAVDKLTNTDGGSCPAPKSLVQDNSILPPDGGKALNVIAAGTLNIALATQLACGATSNPLPADVIAAAIPGCTSGTFVCGNSKLICRDRVCNGANDCGDNSDEGSSMCGAQSCCQVTNGCPGETGSTCGGTCCCCPFGQACDRVNPGRGCVASN